MFSRVFSRDNSVNSDYGTASFSNSRESSYSGSTESSIFRDSNSTQRASSVYSRYRECIEPIYMNIKVPRIWISDSGEMLKDRPSDVSSSNDEESNEKLSSSNKSSRSSLSSITDEDGDFENIDDGIHEDPTFSAEEWLKNTSHQELLENPEVEKPISCTRKEAVVTPSTAPLSPTSISGQNSPARLSPVNNNQRSPFSIFKPKPL